MALKMTVSLDSNELPAAGGTVVVTTLTARQQQLLLSVMWPATIRDVWQAMTDEQWDGLDVEVADLIACIGANCMFVPGFVMAWAGSTPPATGQLWLPCEGGIVPIGLYPELFAAIGYAYGGSGGSFRLPNLRGRVIAGVDASAATAPGLASIGATTGEHEVELSADQNGLHSHAGKARYTTTTTHTHSKAGVLYNGVAEAGQPNLGTSLQYVTENSGLGEPHNNVQPTIAMAYYIFSGRVTI
jgi:microcystin-dependent protein